jgi:hypothetical protein
MICGSLRFAATDNQSRCHLGINVALVDESQVTSQTVNDPRNYLTKLATGPWLTIEGSVCLRFVYPFGDTTFNQAQLPELLSELQRSADAQTNPEIRAHLQKVCHLVSAARNQVHMYVKFIGD